MVRFLVAILVLLSVDVTGQYSTVLTWDYRDSRTGEWYTFGEKGTIQERLMQRDLKSPFFLNEESVFTKLESLDWELTSGFYLDSNAWNKKLLIQIPSIDTYAQIFINDVLVGETTNAFHPYQFDIDSLVRIGENYVKLIFTPPVKYHEDKSKEELLYPAPNDVGGVKVASLTRKPQYHFGWDWTMRLNTIGLNMPVSIVEYDPYKIVHARVETMELTGKDAKLNLSIHFQDSIFGKHVWKSERFGSVELDSGSDLWEWEVDQKSAVLWWPRGQGEQFIYDDRWLVYNSDNQLIKSIDVKYGVRKSELIQQADDIGVTYEIQLNNRPIFCKGSNYVPPSIFSSEIDSTRLENDVEIMVKSNFNMIRVWGGGMYLPDYFYTLCDSLGVMVWQDFMFACAMYPASDEFMKEVENELSYQVPRLSAHPSVVLFNGNNEVEVAYTYWGLKESLDIGDAEWKQIGKDKDQLFKRLIPDLVHAKSVLPYIYTSPLSNWGSPERFDSGSQHYWGVWHGNDDPFDGFAANVGRFNSEYGYQSFPQLSTLYAFADSNEMNLDSEVMKTHQKSYVGNDKILNHITTHYRKPKNFTDFVYLSQVLQADCIETAIVSHRLARERCAGTLYWQFNDCYPGITWSGIDYFGNWKAVQYKIRDAFRDQVVLKNDAGEYYWLNDVPDSAKTSLKIEFSGNDGYYRSVEIELACKANQKVQIILPKRFEKKLKAIGGILDFTWMDIHGNKQTASFTYRFSKRFIFEPKYEIYSYDENSGEGYIRIQTKGLLKDVWIQDVKGEAVFNTNFIDFVKGEYLIKFNRPTSPVNSDFILNWN